MRNEALARQLWGIDIKSETTWEYIYFLEEINKQDIPVELFNKIAGYKSNNVIQGFTLLNYEKSQSIIDYFDFASETYLPPVDEKEYIKAIKEFDPTKELDIESKGKARTEQSFLRKILFKDKKNGTCGICGKIYPVSFLVAAHIKLRAVCTVQEKLDFKNIVMPMCKFGCDELYEKGYIVVDNGKIKSTDKGNRTESMDKYIEHIIGRTCSYWNENNSKYFEWHFDKNELFTKTSQV